MDASELLHSRPSADMVIFDGAALLHMIRPRTPTTFDDYALHIASHIRHQFEGAVKRVDIIFDVYKSESLKAPLRQKRGGGKRQRVEAQKNVPGNWNLFLRNDGNKTDLFKFVAERVVASTFPGLVVVTHGEDVMFSGLHNTDCLSPCSQEEADTRMFLHAADGIKQGYSKLLIRTCDTDVAVLAVSMSRALECEQLWLAFGSGNTFRYIDATLISEKLGPLKSKALPALHALTGCDVTSSFTGRGKKTAWAVWNAFNEVTPALCTLAEKPDEVEIGNALPVIEKYVVLMYDRNSVEETVNSARQCLFFESREIENLPPTQDALKQHLLRVGYQAGHVWSQALVREPTLPSPSDFGWVRDDRAWRVRWMTQPPAGTACRAVIKCGCLKGCGARCQCKKAQLPCTLLCKCKGCHQKH